MKPEIRRMILMSAEYDYLQLHHDMR